MDTYMEAYRKTEIDHEAALVKAMLAAGIERSHVGQAGVGVGQGNHGAVFELISVTEDKTGKQTPHFVAHWSDSDDEDLVHGIEAAV